LGDTFVYTIEVSGKYLNYSSPIFIHHTFPGLPSNPPQVISPVNPNIVVGPSGFDWAANATQLPVNITVSLTTTPVPCLDVTSGQFSTSLMTYSVCTSATTTIQSPTYLFNNVLQSATTTIGITTTLSPSGPYETGVPDNGDMIQNGYEGDFVTLTVDISISSTGTWSNAYYKSDFVVGESLVNGTLKINLNDGNGYNPVPSAYATGALSVSLGFLSSPTYFNSSTIGTRTFSITFKVTFDDSAFSKFLVSSISH